jgi:triphosphatase
MSPISRGKPSIVETELKFAVESHDIGRLTSHRSLVSIRPTIKSLVSVYFDTADQLLHEAGMSLRLRTSNDRTIQTLKLQAAQSSGLFIREEYEIELVGDEPDIDAIRKHFPSAIYKKLRQSLQPAFRIEVQRTEWLLQRKNNNITVTLDEGMVRTESGSEPICELEVELRSGKVNAVFELAREVAQTIPLRLEMASKADRGYLLLGGGAGRAVKASPVQLAENMTAAAAFHVIASACIRQFAVNATLLLNSPEPEPLHQMRVAIRRFRSLLSFDGALLPKRKLSVLRLETRRVFRTLGKIRDLDILIASLEHAGNSLPSTVTLLALREKREAAYAKVVAMLRSTRFCRRLIDLVAFIECGPFTRPKNCERNTLGAEKVKDGAIRILERRWRKLRKFDKISRLEPDQRHRFRIQSKKFRYACEFFGSLFVKQRDRYNGCLQAAESLQDTLGELTDIASMKRLLGRQDDKINRHAASAPRNREIEQALLVEAESQRTQLRKQKPFWIEC